MGDFENQIKQNNGIDFKNKEISNSNNFELKSSEIIKRFEYSCNNKKKEEETYNKKSCHLEESLVKNINENNLIQNKNQSRISIEKFKIKFSVNKKKIDLQCSLETKDIKKKKNNFSCLFQLSIEKSNNKKEGSGKKNEIGKLVKSENRKNDEKSLEKNDYLKMSKKKSSEKKEK